MQAYGYDFHQTMIAKIEAVHLLDSLSRNRGAAQAALGEFAGLPE